MPLHRTGNLRDPETSDCQFSTRKDVEFLSAIFSSCKVLASMLLKATPSWAVFHLASFENSKEEAFTFTTSLSTVQQRAIHELITSVPHTTPFPVSVPIISSSFKPPHPYPLITNHPSTMLTSQRFIGLRQSLS